MTYIQHYNSPIGGLLLSADEIGLTGLWIDGEKYFADNLPSEHEERETPILAGTARWLDIYFSGKERRSFITKDLLSDNRYGKYFWIFLTAKQLRTEILQNSLRQSRGLPVCPRRRSAER